VSAYIIKDGSRPPYFKGLVDQNNISSHSWSDSQSMAFRFDNETDAQSLLDKLRADPATYLNKPRVVRLRPPKASPVGNANAEIERLRGEFARVVTFIDSAMNSCSKALLAAKDIASRVANNNYPGPGDRVSYVNACDAVTFGTCTHVAAPDHGYDEPLVYAEWEHGYRTSNSFMPLSEVTVVSKAKAVAA
jgi:hypothetical protein